MNVKPYNNKLTKRKKLEKTSLWQNALIRNVSANNNNKKARMNFMR
jgi:hypothetical protein